MIPKKISEETKFQTLYDHYKDSFHNICKNIKVRNRIFLFILILLGLQFFQIFAPSETSKVIIDLLKSKAGLQISFHQYAIDAIVWFVLLSVIIRYYQVNIYIDRQYNYIHGIEDTFKKMTDEKLIFREGYAYLSNYPKFSEGIYLLYIWIFPVLILFTGALKIYNDYPGKWRLSYIFSAIFFLAIVVFTYLYLQFHFYKKKYMLKKMWRKVLNSNLKGVKG